MVDEKRLDALIKGSGYKRKFLADKLGITDVSFSAKCHNRQDFTTTEAGMLADVLKIPTGERGGIFFASNVAENENNSEVTS